MRGLIKKRILIIALFVLMLICFMSICDYFEKKRAQDLFIEKYNNTLKSVSDNIDTLELMCEFDLKHYQEYKYTESNSKSVYKIPKVGEYQNARNILFTEIGFNGFDVAYIYPEESYIEFYDSISQQESIHLYYFQSENNTSISDGEKIGDHFVIQYINYPFMYE